LALTSLVDNVWITFSLQINKLIHKLLTGCPQASYPQLMHRVINIEKL
jgi:hypothetical protein